MQISNSWAEILFQTMLFFQILIVSLLIPTLIMKKLKNTFEHYPPAQYPRLYPTSIAYYQRKQNLFLYTNYFIFGTSIVLWILGVFYFPQTMQKVISWNNNSFITFYFLMQFLPVILILGREELKQYKRMREADDHPVRKASFYRRTLLDYISLPLVILALLSYLGFILFIEYFKQFNYSWFGGYWNIVGITFMNVVNVSVIIWYLYGKKLNPHQTDNARFHETKSVINLIVAVSIFATLFVVLKILVKAIDMNSISLLVSSFYVQILAWIQYKFIFKACSGKYTDFSVYKNPVSP